MEMNKHNKSLALKKTAFASSLSLALASMAAMSGAPVLAQSGQELQRVEVTGSSIRRIDAESAVSVQVITRDDIAKSGVTSTEQLLQSISSLSSAGGINNASGAGSSTYGNSTISMRGLESARTLVLVNGRRLATFANGSAAVNVNVIPMSAIERVEVLKDGASSVYGADAMAGVVNFILTKSFNGFEVGYTSSRPTDDGGGQNRKVTLLAGTSSADSRLKAVVSLSMETDVALFAKDRKYAASGNNFPYYTAAATGQGNIEGAVIPGAYPNDRVPVFGTSPGTGWGNPNAAAGTCAAIKMFDAGLTNKGKPYCQFDSNAFVGLIPARELVNMTGNATFKLNNDAEAFVDYLQSRSTVVQTFQPSPLRRGFALTNNRLLGEKVDPSLIIYPTNPNYPKSYIDKFAPNLKNADGTYRPLAVTARVFDFGGRQSTDEATQTRAVAGVRGQIMGQDYEVAYMQNISRLDGRVTGGYFSVTDYNKIINDPASNWNPWSTTGQSAELQAKLAKAEYKGGTLAGESKNEGIDAKISGDLFTIAGGTVQYAVGTQSREEKLLRTPSAAGGTGDIAGLGGAAFAIDKSRNTSAVFAEVNVPITKGLEANASVRSDQYSDFGTASTYKVSTRWQPVRDVILRASVNTGFRAPTLPDLYQPQILGTTEQFDDTGPGGTGQTDLQVNGLTGGNPKLQPEKSRANSIGVVVTPIKGLSVGLDWFKIRIDDIIQTPGAQEVVSGFRRGDAAFRGLVKLAPGSNDIDRVDLITSNLGQADVQGIDLFAAYRTSMGSHQFGVDLNGTLMQQFDQTSPGGDLSQKVGTIVKPDGTPVLGADAGGVILRWKHKLDFSWKMGDITTTFSQNYTDKYRASNDLNDNPVYVAAQSIYDLNVTYTGFKNARLSVGAKNLFNAQPGVFVPVSNQFQAGYDISQYDPRGRTIYGGFTYKF